MLKLQTTGAGTRRALDEVVVITTSLTTTAHVIQASTAETANYKLAMMALYAETSVIAGLLHFNIGLHVLFQVII